MSIAGSNEIYRKLSSQIASQFPEFIQEDGPKFVSFLKAYFEYMEQSAKAGERTRALFDIADVDRTISDFISYFQKEFLINIPSNALANKALLTKHINSVYRARGTTESYKFLFRILFDKEVEIIYPSEQILRVSDGRWVKESVIRVGGPFSAEPFILASKEITGATSGAKAFVENVILRKISGIAIYEMSLSNVSGTFKDGEVVSDGTNNSTIFTGIGTLTGLDIIKGGANHVKGDILSFSSPTDSGTATITSIANNSAILLKITSGGTGYTVGNGSVTITGGSGTGGAADIVTIANTLSRTFSTDRINSLKNVTLNRGTKFVTGGSNTTAVSAQLALANISTQISSGLKFVTMTTGTIDKIIVSDPGLGYSTKPTAYATDSFVSSFGFDDTYNGYYYRSGTGAMIGNNAIITANNAAGSIVQLKITTAGITFTANATITVTNLTQGNSVVSDTYSDNTSVTRTTMRHKTFTPTLTPGGGLVSSAVISLPGSYIDSSSLLDGYSKLHDGNYYQQYSYVIRITETMKKYKNIVEKLLHPVGTKMFSELDMPLFMDLNQYLDITNVIGFIMSLHIGVQTITVSSAQSATANANASGTANLTISSAQSGQANVNASGTANLTISSAQSGQANANASGTANLTISSAESATANSNASGTANLTISSAQSATANSNASGTANLTISSAESGQANSNAIGTADLTFTSAHIGAKFTLYPSTQIAVQYANNVTQAYAAANIGSYANIPVGIFDNSLRLIVTVVGASKFANGSLKATSGLISNTGAGSNTMITPVGNSENFTQYQVNAIFSNTSFTLRTNHSTAVANATFKYFV